MPDHSSQPLFGRDGERTALAALLDDLAQASSAVAVELLGEPGIGKTRLLAELAAQATERRMLVLEGRAAELERDVPFAPFVDALDAYAASLPDRRLEELGDEVLGELAALLPSLPRRRSDAVALHDERYRSHQAVRALLELLAGERPAVVCLDDVHWADAASLELIGHLLRRRPRAPALLALAYRPGQAPELLSTALAAATAPADLRLELGPLAPREAEALLGDRVSAAERAALYRESGGNPFFLDQLARGHGARSGDAPTGVGLPRALVAACSEELAALDDDARALAEGAAVAGDPFLLELAAAAAGQDEPVALAALDRLDRAGLVRPAEYPRQFRFRHPIVRRAAYDLAPAAWRLGAHARVAEALAATGAPASARAHHVTNAAAPGDTSAVAVLAEAGHAAALRAPASAAAWFGRALDLLAPGAGTQRLELLVPMATALGASGELEGSRAALREALELLPGDATAVRVKVVTFIALIEHMLGRHGEARALLHQTLAALPDPESAEAAALKIELAMDAFYDPDYETQLRWARVGHATASRLDDRGLRATAAGALALALKNVGDTGGATAANAEAAQIVEELSDDELAGHLEALVYLGWSDQSLDFLPEGEAVAERGLRISRATGQGHLLVPLTIGLAISITWQGRLAEAAELAERMIDTARLTRNPQALCWALTLRCWVATLAGDLDLAAACGEEAEAVAAAGVRHNYFSALTGCYLAETRLEAGEPARCRAAILAAGGGEELPIIERPFRAHFYDILARAAAAEHDPAAAERWAGRAEQAIADQPIDGRVAEAYRARAAALMARGEPAAAAERALAAAEAAAGCGLVLEAARNRAFAGRAIGATGDTDRAAELLRGAIAELDRFGAAGFAAQARRDLRRLGRRFSRRAAAAEAEDADGLTEREREIANLVAAGSSNRDIAGALFLAESTVETHLTRLYRKLGVRSRAAVPAALAASERRDAPH